MTEAEERERYRYLQLKAKMAQAAPAQPEAPAVAAPPQVGVGETLLNSTGKALPGGHVLSNALTALGLSALGPSAGARLTPQAAAELGMPQEAARPGLVDNYRAARDRLAERTAAGTQQNPWASGIGTGIGTALSLAAPLPKVTVGSGATGRILSNALTAGSYGALNGALNSRGDLTQGDVGQVLKDTVGVEGLQRAAEDWKAGKKGRAALDVMGAGGVGGALTGGVLGAGVEVARRPLQAALNATTGAFDRLADKKTLQALGAMKPELNRLGNDRAQQLARFAEEKGITGGLASRQTMLGRVQALQEAAGRRIGDTLSEANNLALPSERLGSTDAVQRLEQLAAETEAKPALRNIANKFRNEAENIRAVAAPGEAPGGMSLQDYEEKIVRPYKQTTNWNSDLALPKETLKSLPRALEAQVEQVADRIGQRTGKGDLLSRYQGAKQEYGKLMDLSDIVDEGIKRQTPLHSLSLKDAVLAAPAVMLGHGSPSSLALGAGGLLASKMANRFGDQLMATGARGTANALRAAPDLTPNIARALSSGSARLAPAEQLRLLQYAQALRGETP